MKINKYLYVICTVIGLWYCLYILDSKHIVPSPELTLIYLISHFHLLLNHSLYSLFRIFIAIAVTMVSGTVLGLLCGINTTVDRFITPLLYAFYPIPKIAFLPIIMLWFGIGDLSKIILVGSILFFQITVSVRDAVHDIPDVYLVTFKLYHASHIALFKHLYFPALLPKLLSALRISVGTSVSVLFFAENFATQYGIGYYIMDSWLKLNYPAMFAGIIMISLLGTSLFLIIDFLELKICRWQ